MGILSSLSLRKQRLEKKESRLTLHPAESRAETLPAKPELSFDDAAPAEASSDVSEDFVLSPDSDFEHESLEVSSALPEPEFNEEDEPLVLLDADSDLFVSDAAAESLLDDGTAVDESSWNLELLQSMDWKLFEDLCAEAFRKNGYRIEKTRSENSGVDLVVYGPDEVGVAVQSRSYAYPVQLREVRECSKAAKRLGHEKLFFIAASGFNQASTNAFANDPSIKLVDGAWLLKKIEALGSNDAADLLKLVVGNGSDWQTPTCPDCDVKMVRRTKKRTGESFWGCQNFANTGAEKCWRRL